MSPRLQRVIARVLALFLPRRTAETMAADLSEEWVVQRRSARHPADLLWATHQVLSLAGALLLDRLRPQKHSLRRTLPFPASGAPVASFVQDLRFAVRILRRHPLHTAAIIGMLSLALGANTAIFSLVNGVLLRPLDLPEPDRVMVLLESNVAEGALGQTVSPPKFVDWSAQSTTFAHLAAYTGTGANMSGEFAPERIRGSYVSSGMLATLGVAPRLGRAFRSDEYVEGAADAVLLTDEFWRRKFAADPGVVGSTVELTNVPHRIVGVLPPFEQSIGLGDLLLPYSEQVDNRRIRYLNVLGRLADDAEMASARREMATIAARLELAYPASDTGWSIDVVPLRERILGDSVRPLRLLQAAVGLVLLIACVNVAHLMLMRSDARQRELSVRQSLGASSWRIVRQVLTEGLVLGLTSVALAIGLATFAVSALQTITPAAILRRTEVGLDGTVLGFSALLAIACTLLVSFLPARRAARSGLLGSGARGNVGGGRLRHALLVPEVALAVVLAIAAALLLRSFDRLTRVDTGFDADEVLTFRMTLPSAQFPGTQGVSDFVAELSSRLEALPGVDAVEVSNAVPLSGPPWFNVQVAEVAESGEAPSGPGPMRIVTPRYLEALGIRRLAGRDFTDRDDASAPPVMLLDVGLANRLFPGTDAVGKRVRVFYDDAAVREVVGIVDGVRQWGLEGPASAGYYVPVAQVRWGTTYFALKTAGDAMSLLPAARAAALELAPDLPIYDVETMRGRIRASLGEPRFQMMLLTLFAGVALSLATAGVVGVTLFSVARRQREIGVRMALGARGTDVVRLVVRQGLGHVGVGLGVGLLLAYLSSGLMAGQLFEIEPLDATTYAAVAAGVLALTGFAVWAPARRAAAVDPVRSIRQD